MIKRKDELTKVVGPIEGGKGEISRELLIEGYDDGFSDGVNSVED